ncbi:STAS domain-containing protein [Arhodomonas sp. SL1]|uniref:STAS domain-containing protein n=1 Tax=Arhodomonas sp. SL1 TaxID=3425691 RepID=UPI003F8828C0
MSAALDGAGEGALRVTGELDFDSVALLPAALPGSGDAVVDLSAVERADSAGLALLLEWVRVARAAGRQVRFRGIPRQLLAIARVSGVDAILPLEDNEPIPNP